MNSLDLIFIFFGLLAVGSALALVFVRNVFRAAFLLLICLISIAGIYVLLSATYMAIVQLLVYAGGIVVLLSFGIMLTNRAKSGVLETSHHLVVPGLVVFLGLCFLLYQVFLSSEPILISDIPDKVSFVGESFMTQYILSFEAVAFLLLAVLVGSSLYAKSSSDK